MTESSVEIRNCLVREIEKCTAMEAACMADGREDEAVRVRIRKNVFDILLAVLTAAVKRGGTEQEIRSFFLTRSTGITNHWYDSLRKAGALGDAQRMEVERVKVNAYEDALAVANRVWGAVS